MKSLNLHLLPIRIKFYDGYLLGPGEGFTYSIKKAHLYTYTEAAQRMKAYPRQTTLVYLKRFT